MSNRYIEIFKSSVHEAYGAVGQQRMGMRPLLSGGIGGMQRPSPYDRNNRGFGMGGGMGMGGGGGGMGMGGYGMGRGGRNVKGFFDDEYDDFGGGYGGGSGFGMNRRSMGGMGMGGMRGPQRGGGGRMGGGGGNMQRQRGATPGSHYVSRTGHSVHMRGLPFQALESDIAEFFAPLTPVSVEFEYGPNGRPTGEANVDFKTHQQAVEAMKNHKKNMEHRYIELFLNSSSDSRANCGDGGGFGGGMSGNMGNMGGGNMGGNNMGGGNMGGGFGGNYNGDDYGDNMNYMGNEGYGSGNMSGGMGTGGMGGGMSGMGGGMSGGMNRGMGGGNMGMGGGGGMNNNVMGNPNYTAF